MRGLSMERDTKGLVLGLRKCVEEIDAQLKIIEKSDIFKENAELTQKNEKLGVRLEKTERELARLSADNASLKNALYEQYFNEKTNTVAKAKRSAEIFFAGETAAEANRLAALENNIKHRLEYLRIQWKNSRSEIADAADEKIRELQRELSREIADAKNNVGKLSVSEEEKQEFERLKEESLTGEQITELSRTNNFERYIGLNILNTVGIVLFIIGAIAAGQFGYIWVSFALGLGFLVAGEVFNRKRPTIFSLGITAGGV